MNILAETADVGSWARQINDATHEADAVLSQNHPLSLPPLARIAVRDRRTVGSQLSYLGGLGVAQGGCDNPSRRFGPGPARRNGSHLEGVSPGSQVSVIKIDPKSGERLGLLATATVGDGGWVDLPQPIIVKAGEGFIAVPVTHHLTLTTLPDTYALCRLDTDAAVPVWATTGGFSSITRAAEELSIVCVQSLVPDGVRCERDWRCFQVAGPIPFSTVGVLASLVQPLAEAGISVFAISTFDTDYLLVKAADLQRAIDALRQNGHAVGNCGSCSSILNW